MKFGKKSEVYPSLAVDFLSPAISIESMVGYSISLSWTDAGALNGTLQVQASNNALLDNMYGVVDPNAIWDDVTGANVVMSGANTQMINADAQFYKYYRLKYTATAGNGTLRVEHFYKGRI